MTYRVRNIAIAVGLALVAAMLTIFYVTNYKRSVQQGESQVEVFVAAKDIPAGVSGTELVKRHQLKSVQVTKRSVVAGAISDTDQVDKLVLSQPLYRGEQITLRRFADVQALGIRSQLKGTMRAVQVPGSSDQLLAGTLKAGDHVDIVAKFNPSQGVSLTRIVLRDLLVLSPPQQPTGTNVAQDTGWSMLVAITDTQVQRLWHTIGSGSNSAISWSFELRPVADAVDSSERVESNATVQDTGVSDAEIARLRRGGR